MTTLNSEIIPDSKKISGDTHVLGCILVVQFCHQQGRSAMQASCVLLLSCLPFPAPLPNQACSKQSGLPTAWVSNQPSAIFSAALRRPGSQVHLPHLVYPTPGPALEHFYPRSCPRLVPSLSFLILPLQQRTTRMPGESESSIENAFFLFLNALGLATGPV